MFRPDYDPKQFYHWHKVQTRFRDLDPLNHSNNAVFNTYFEEARINFTHSIPDLRNSFEEGFAFVLVKCTIEYLKPIRYPSELLIGSSVLGVGNTSLEGIQAIYEGKTKELLNCLWDAKTYRPDGIVDAYDLLDDVCNKPKVDSSRKCSNERY